MMTLTLLKGFQDIPFFALSGKAGRVLVARPVVPGSQQLPHAKVLHTGRLIKRKRAGIVVGKAYF